MSLRRYGTVLTLVAAGSLAVFGQDLMDGLERTPRRGSNAGQDVQVPEVSGVIVHADYNTEWKDETDKSKADALKDTIEGSVSFMVDVPFKTIVKHMRDAGTLGKISPNIETYEAKVAEENRDMVKYKVRETLVPFKVPLVSLAKSEVNLDLTINKKALQGGRILVEYQLDPEKKSDWKRFSGAIYGVNLHNGKTMVMVQTSTKSNYSLLPGVRLKLAKYFLGKTKDNIVNWVKGLEEAR